MTLVLFTMLFHGGLIPTYMVVQNLGMLDTRWAMVIPQAIGVWQVIIARTYFRTAIPDELAEAAAIDGCSDLRFLWSVVLPLAKPMIAVIALMYAIFQWNCLLRRLDLPEESGPVPACSWCCVTSSSSTPRRWATADVARPARTRTDGRPAQVLLIVVASMPVTAHLPVRRPLLHQGGHDRRDQGLTDGPRRQISRSHMLAKEQMC